MIKITAERIIIVVLLVILAFRNCSSAASDCPPAAKVEIEKKTVTTIDSASNKEIKDQVPEKIQVIERAERVERVVDPEKIPVAERKEVKEVFRYLDTTNLDGALIFSEILSEGRILETNLVAEIDHQETTITKTIVLEPGGFFVSPGVDLSPVGGLEAVETTLTYIKGNFGGSIGPYYNFRQIPQSRDFFTGSLGLKFKIHFKL